MTTYLTNENAKNTFLPQWYWENCHPAIIQRDVCQKAQELLAEKNYLANQQKPETMKKRSVVARVKNGILRGYFLMDMTWTKEERDQFINTIESIKYNADAERN